jgi:hypothetical protein
MLVSTSLLDGKFEIHTINDRFTNTRDLLVSWNSHLQIVNDILLRVTTVYVRIAEVRIRIISQLTVYNGANFETYEMKTFKDFEEAGTINYRDFFFKISFYWVQEIEYWVIHLSYSKYILHHIIRSKSMFSLGILQWDDRLLLLIYIIVSFTCIGYIVIVGRVS